MARVCHGCTDRSPQAQVGAPWHARRQAGPHASRGECSERRCMPSLRHASPRRPRRGAQRRARRRRDREAPWHAPQRGRSRAAAAQLAGTGASADRTAFPRRRHIPPSCVTTATPSLFNGYGCGCGPRLAQFRPGFLRPLVLQRKVRYDGIHVPTFPRHSAGGRSASGLRPLRRSTQGLPGLRAMRRRRYVDVPARIGTGSPAPPCTGSAGPSTSLHEPGPYRFRCRSSP